MRKMTSKEKLMNAVRFLGISILTIGIVFFFIGFFKSGPSILTPIGIGTIMGGVFIFLMGIFLAVTEEMIEKKHEKETNLL